MKTLDEVRLTDRERDILRKIQGAARSVLPDATVIFYGSGREGCTGVFRLGYSFAD